MANNVLQAIADGLKRGGVKDVYNFPGFHSHELFDLLGGKLTSTNEKIAYELAWGSSQAGRPAVVTFKNVGLNDAADPFINSMLTGIGSGLVVVVFDNIELEGSQAILDSRHYFSFYGGLWLEPYDLLSAIVLSEAAIRLSSTYNIPVVLRLTNQALAFTDTSNSSFPSAKQIIQIAERTTKPSQAIVPVVHPAHGNTQRQRIQHLQLDLQAFSDDLHALVNPKDNMISIYSGYSSSEATYHIVSLPVPGIGTSNVAEIHEIGDDVISASLASMQYKTPWESNQIGYNPKNASRVIVSDRYRDLFGLLKPHFQYIAGDLGEYTKDTLDTITHCLCFGSAISVATGMLEAGSSALAVIGDAAFYHSGQNVITEAMQRAPKLKVVLLDNHGSQGTGGQVIPGVIPNDIKVLKIDLDTIALSDLHTVLQTFLECDTPILMHVIHK